MCKYTFGPESLGSAAAPLVPSYLSTFDALIKKVKLVGYGIDTFVVNVRYADDASLQPVQQELDEGIQEHLNALQAEAKEAETSVVSPWSFLGAVLFMEPHGAGRQWRWLLTCPLLSLVVARGTFNGLIAQVRFSSEYLWSQPWLGDALSKVHDFLMTLFGPALHLQVSSIDLCADVMGYDYTLANYEQDFISRARKQAVVYGPDAVNLDGHVPSYLRFSSSASPISCRIYNKTLEIVQKSKKTWMYDVWRKGTAGLYGGTWDGETPVWRHEFHLKREFLRNLADPIEGAYEVLDQLPSLWKYAAGCIEGGADGLPDGWLRYALPTEDSNRSRWPTHPAWIVAQSAFAEPVEPDLGPVVRQRIREKNLDRGLAAMIGYASTMSAWLAGPYAEPDADMSLTFQWLYEHGQAYLDEKGRDYLEEVWRKQKLYHSEHEA